MLRERSMNANSFPLTHSFCTANVWMRCAHMSVKSDACLVAYSTFIHVHCFEEVAINLTTTKTTNEPQQQQQQEHQHSHSMQSRKQIFYRWDFHWVLIFSCLASIIRIKQRIKDEKQKMSKSKEMHVKNMYKKRTEYNLNEWKKKLSRL